MTEIEIKAQEDKDKKAMETIVEAVTEKSVPIIMEKIKAEQPLRKDIFEDGSVNERKEATEKKQKAAEYFKALVNRGNTKALSSGTSTSGSELVPTYVSDQLINVAQKYGLIRKYARNWPMQGMNENVPTATSVTAYRLGGDTAAINSSQATTGAVQLRAKTIGVIVPISRVLLENSTINLVDAITFLCGKAIAKLEDQWGFLGLAAGEGIFQNASVPVTTLATGGTTYNKALAEDLLTVIDSLDENYLDDNLRWIMSHSVLNNFRRIRSVVGTDKQGFLLENLGGVLPPTLWDIPYDTSAVMPKNSDGSQTSKDFLALANYDNIIHGDSMEYTTEMSNEATIVDSDGSTLINMFQQNMVALKVWGRIDIQLSNASGAFGILKTSAS